MALNLSKRPFWTGTPRALDFGDMILRYSATATPVDGSTVNLATAAKRMGSTNFDKVGNRVPWLGFDENGNTLLALTKRRVGSRKLPFDGPGYFVRHHEAYIVSGFEGTMRRAIESHSRGDIGGFKPTIPFAGTIRAGYVSIVQGNPGRLVTATDVVGFGPMASRFPGISMSVSGFDVAAMDVQTDYHLFVTTVIGGAAYTATSGGVSNGTSRVRLHPDSGAFRTRLGLPLSLPNGEVLLPSAETAYLAAGGFVHGIHDAVKVIVLKSQDEGDEVPSAQFVFAVFTKDDIISIVNGQKQYAAAEFRPQMTQLVNEVSGMPDVEFALLIADEPIGPMDIYHSLAIRQALNGGVEISEIDSTVVQGRRCDEWRRECLAQPKRKAIMWIASSARTRLEQPAVIPAERKEDFTLLPVPPSGAKCHVSQADLLGAISSQGLNDLSVSELVGILETKYSCTIATGFDDLAFDKARTRSYCEPWTDLPMAWWQACGVKSLQPLANCLTAALLESKKPFEVP